MHGLDIDECSTNPDICPKDANCSNTIGGYCCTCGDGYISTPDVQCGDTSLNCTGMPFNTKTWILVAWLYGRQKTGIVSLII